MRRFVTGLFIAAVILALPSVAFAAEEKPLKIGFVYVSPANEAGWSYAHDQARQELAKMPGVTTFITESVPEGADSERVILQMARKGYDIIFTTSFGYMDPTIKVAKQFPKITFLHCSGFKTAENVSNYFGRMYQARYLTGMAAGAMTKKNVIGYAAAFPIPEVIRGINAFTMGVRAVNPKAEVRVMWTKTWYDVATEKEAGKRLVDAGCDVIAQHQDSPGPQEAAAERGVYSVGYNTDMSVFAPKAHLVAATWDWAPFYKDIVAQVRAGTWKAGAYWPGLESGIVNISKFGPMVPKDVQDQILKRKEEIIKGQFVVFAGPVKDQKGAVRIPEGKNPADADLLNMNWFVEGVVGSTE
ncbi:BMP family ABC transporter substrate-binding protein [Desulfovibrio sp. OttesenSCG-928-O18]|nr:BMP family ABC transporter substrate-binding protein [Desulfovibrio sp. OttesenSCG-928-O18]